MKWWRKGARERNRKRGKGKGEGEGKGEGKVMVGAKGKGEGGRGKGKVWLGQRGGWTEMFEKTGKSETKTKTKIQHKFRV